MEKKSESAAFGSDPALQGTNEPGVENPKPHEESIPQNKDVVWTAEAEQYLQDATKFVRSKIRSNAESKALAMGLKEITRDFIENLRK